MYNRTPIRAATEPVKTPTRLGQMHVLNHTKRQVNLFAAQRLQRER